MDRNRKPLTRAECVEIRDAYAAGDNIQTLRRKFHRSYSVVKKIIAGSNEATDPTSAPVAASAPRNRSKLSAAERRRILAAHRGGATLHELQERFHRSHGTVKALVAANDAPRTKKRTRDRVAAANHALARLPSNDTPDLHIAHNVLEAQLEHLQALIPDISTFSFNFATREVGVTVNKTYTQRLGDKK